jgi:hypothetical protein
MIEITSLLLGLLVGPSAVTFTVAPQVVSVVVEVDGRVAAGVVPEGGAGEARVELGGALVPHRVSAIAYDEAGIEIGRATEWVNLPRPEVVARLVLHGDPGAPERAALIWEHLAEDPVTVRRATATLDGRPLAVPDPEDIRLPSLDPGVPHLLALDVTFSNGERMELARAWGGGGGDEVETRLLPYRVATRAGAAWPDDPSAALAACLAAPAGAQVHGLEEEAAEVVVVTDMETLPRVERMLRLDRGRFLGASRSSRMFPLRHGDRLRQVWPVPRHADHRRGQLSIFPSSPASTARGMVSILRERPARHEDAEPRLADAVAGAGLLAYGSGHASAVVLVLAKEDAGDASFRSPEKVRAYLEALGVPLHVWSVAGGGETPWGPSLDVSDLARLEAAVAGLRAELDRQRLVWLSGVGLPQEVRFGDCACCQPASVR